MADTTFNGTTIPYGKTRIRTHDYDLKTWSFPGVDGLQFMPMGDRGRLWSVVGRSVNGGITISTLNGFVDGSAHTLVTGNGTSLTNCVCLGWRYLADPYTDQSGYVFEFELMIMEVEI
ncbi:MAG: hypothetical protein GF400_01720 [Candidatus Eisenbacteria bacterium]|nr:hypothetical protein [Candidatus Eisenbacteria bacterium]